MWIAILIIVVLVIAAATVLMITRGRATTGGLSRETPGASPCRGPGCAPIKARVAPGLHRRARFG